jgi:hypothetical protein
VFDYCQNIILRASVEDACCELRCLLSVMDRKVVLASYTLGWSEKDTGPTAWRIDTSGVVKGVEARDGVREVQRHGVDL